MNNQWTEQRPLSVAFARGTWEARWIMPITVMCPNLACRAVLRVPENVRGKKVRCGECATVFSVPAPNAKPSSGRSSDSAAKTEGMQ